MYDVDDCRFDQGEGVVLFPMFLFQTIFEFVDNFSEEGQGEVERVIDMLIVKRMFLIPDEFIDID